MAQSTSLFSASSRAPLKFFTSTDPKKHNQDYKTIAPGQTMRVPLAAGRLLRLWSTNSEPEALVLQLSNGTVISLLRDNRARVGQWSHKAFTLYPDQSTSAALRDLGANATLLATNRATKPAKWFYQATIGTALPADGASGTPSEARFELAANAAQDLASQAPTGIWTRWEIELPAITPAEALNAWRNLRLQVRWKGEDKLGIDVPLLALSGQFWSVGALKSRAVQFNGKVLSCWLPISFGPDDRVSIFNSGTRKIEVVTRLWQAPAGNPSTLPRLHALFGSTRTKRGTPIPILSARGTGAFVGLALDIRPIAETTRHSFAYLEGNESIVADGAKEEGTGTEDFFNSAWYFPDNPFVQAFGGLTFKNANPPQVSAVRWMLADAVPFRRTFDFTFEHGRANNADDLEYRWVAFWYQQAGGTFEVEDTLKYGATVEQGIAKNGERDALVRRYILGTLATMFVVGAIVAAIARRGRKIEA